MASRKVVGINFRISGLPPQRPIGGHGVNWFYKACNAAVTFAKRLSFIFEEKDINSMELYIMEFYIDFEKVELCLKVGLREQ